MMGCCSGNRSRGCLAPLLVVVVVLLLLSPCSAELDAAAVPVRPGPARRLLVSRPSTSRQKAEEQQQQQQQEMRVGGRTTPFKQATASFGRRIPRSGWNPIQNR